MLVTERMRPLRVGGRIVHQIGLPYHWGVGGDAVVTGDSANDLLGVALDPNVHIQETKVGHLRHPSRAAAARGGAAAARRRTTAAGPGSRRHRTTGSSAQSGGGRRAATTTGAPDRRNSLLRAARPRRRRGLDRRAAAQGLLHRHLDLHRLQGVRGGLQGVERRPRRRPRPARHRPTTTPARSAPAPGGTSRSSSNAPSAEPRRRPGRCRSAGRAGRADAGEDAEPDFRWLMSSDVCKHCTHAACLDVCPTGALFRTEFGTVVVQDDICNGCGYCVPACPFGVIDRRIGDGGRPRTSASRRSARSATTGSATTRRRPAPRPARPSRSSSATLDELRERADAAGRRAARARASTDARLYGDDPDDGVGGAGAFFLLLDEPEVYGLPPDPVVTTTRPAADVHAGRAGRARRCWSARPLSFARRRP